MIISVSFLNVKNSLLYCFSRGLKSWNGGVKYEAFTYFPRHPGDKDPPYEPTKLLMIQRVKQWKGNPYWEKRILTDFKLNGKIGEIAIVKNIPDVLSQLYKVKHLIRIQPIRTPDGIPEENDLDGGFLKENGEFIVPKKLKIDPEKLKLTEDFQTDPARLDAPTLIKDSRNKWENPW